MGIHQFQEILGIFCFSNERWRELWKMVERNQNCFLMSMSIIYTQIHNVTYYSSHSHSYFLRVGKSIINNLKKKNGNEYPAINELHYSFTTDITKFECH